MVNDTTYLELKLNRRRQQQLRREEEEVRVSRGSGAARRRHLPAFCRPAANAIPLHAVSCVLSHVLYVCVQIRHSGGDSQTHESGATSPLSLRRMERKNLEHEERRLSESGASSQHVSEASRSRKSSVQMDYLAQPDDMNEVEDLFQAAVRVVKSDPKKAESLFQRALQV
jgi:hypothetical protein